MITDQEFRTVEDTGRLLFQKKSLLSIVHCDAACLMQTPAVKHPSYLNMDGVNLHNSHRKPRPSLLAALLSFNNRTRAAELLIPTGTVLLGGAPLLGGRTCL